MKLTSLSNSLLLLLLGMVLRACKTYPVGAEKRHQLSGKVIVITGASSGLGRGVALEAARSKATVILAARNKPELEKVAEEAVALGGKALVIPTDVSIEKNIRDVAEQTVACFGRIDVWINNAGIAVLGRYWETPLRDQLRVVNVNLNGTMLGSYYALNQFKKQKSGVLINISSVEAEIPTAYQAAYSISKAGVRTLGNTLRQELRLAGYKNIKVVTILPYALDTPLWDHVAVYTGHAPRMIAMDAPQKAVNTVIHAIFSGRKELAVGWKARLSIDAHRAFPGLLERAGSNIVHKYQATITPPVPPTQGNLYQSLPTPGVEGGIRERMKKEKQQRRATSINK
jgi:short-subunit dehydrogenase